MHVTSQIQYRENGAGHTVVGKRGNCRRFVGGLVFSPSLDKLVLFQRQCMLGNHMSKILRLIFLFLEHSSYIK